MNLPLSLDWLALSLELTSPVREAPAGHTWCKYTPTNVWGSRWCLYNEYGEKVFTLLFNPRSRGFMKEDRALLEVANEWLYHGLGVTGVLNLLSMCAGYRVTGVNRVDLAADFVPDAAQRDVILGLDTRRYRVQGKQNGSGFWSQAGAKGNVADEWLGFCPHDMNWGHKTSDVKWKLYYKSKELRDAAGGRGYEKPYIVDMWRECGMDIDRVWRLEVSLTNCNTFDFMGDRLDYYRLMHSTCDIFNSLYTSRFVVRANEGHADKSNDAIIPFLPVGKLKGAFKVHREKVVATRNGATSLLRHLVADVQTEPVLLNEPIREATLATIETILDANGMHEYFLLMTGESFDSWREWLRVKAYYWDEQPQGLGRTQTDAVELAMVDAGLIDTDPLGTPSSMSPQRSATGRQQELWSASGSPLP